MHGSRFGIGQDIARGLSRRQVLGTVPAIAAAPLLRPMGAFAQDTPQRGGTLKVGWSDGSTDDSLDPTTYVAANTYMTSFTLGNCLVELTPDKTPIPELAESWESSFGARVWAFKIRKGVQFHNGKELTPADVVYSLNLHVGEGSTSSAKAFLATVTRIYADGDEVIVELSAGDADIPVILADFHFPIVPEGFTDWNNFVGTGPYVLESWEPAKRFTANRNPNYWKADRAWFDRVECYVMNELSDRRAALLAGDVHFIDAVDFITFNTISGDPNFVAQESPGSAYVCSVMDVREPPFDDVNVRRALKAACPRQDTIDKVLGYAEMANDHPVPSTDPFHHSELPQRQFDPDQAAFYLREAGLDSLSISLHGADAAFPLAVDQGILFQDTAGLVGVDIEVVERPDDGYWSNVWMQEPFCQVFWFVRPTPGMMYSVAFACDAAWNDSFWCNDQFNDLLAASKIETDFAKRKQIFWDMQELTHDDGGVIIPAFRSDLELYSRKLRGIEPTAFGRLAGFRLAERGWFG